MSYSPALLLSEFTPLLLEPKLFWVNVVSEALLGLSYLLIPIALYRLAGRRGGRHFHRVLVLLATIVFAGAATHIFGVVTAWNPDPSIAGALKAVVAAITIVSAAILCWIVPSLAKLPSRRELEEEIERRLAAQAEMERTQGELAKRVGERTADLQREIEERKAAEVEAFRLAALAESSNDAIIAVDGDGLIVYWNKAAEYLFDWRREDVLGKPATLLVPIDGEGDAALLRDTHPIGISSFETVRRRQDGSEIAVSLTRSPIYDSQRKLLGASLIVRDITARKAVERELQDYRQHLEILVSERTAALAKSQEQLRRRERLASIGAFSAGIAHEINNPIGAIVLIAQNALDGLGEEPCEQLLTRSCEKILANARRCGKIVKGVLQFSRQEQTEKWPNELNGIVHRCLQLSNEMIERSQADIKLDLTSELPAFPMNPIEVEQAIIQLVQNAIESTNGPAQITIRTQLGEGKATLSIRDNGRGMDEEEKKHIFDPFFTTRQQTGGTGLGMSVVHGVVQGHGGSIEIESEQGKGTTVTISLPLTPPVPQEVRRMMNSL